MSEVKIYLKPRPVYGHANYLPFQWHPDFKYGPFFAGYGTIPSDATEYLQTEVPEITRALLPSLVELERTEMRPLARFVCESQSHANRLYTGDHTPFLLPTELRTDSEWDDLFFSILARGDVELRDDNTELEISVWAYMHYMVFYFCIPWLKFQRDLRHLGVARHFQGEGSRFPIEITRKGNTNNEPPNDPSTATPSFVLRRRNRPIPSEEADLA
ncbi:hypothetical protein ARMGADRAFT_1172364 [Armillaria gallica]|uniref:Uncharacterized protein n=1 Tax=Armillaria gallica TaxID=47427 RepID=A0A2H3CJY1_ARMGA|nr:hypothetical protein ARMGADRAFT_1172364 [Armillaria gallica]